MKNIVVTLIIGIFTIANTSGATKGDTRIVNGTVVANRAQFPYQVSLRVKSANFHFCGGTIIAQGVILTAAHCFKEHPVSSVVAVVGDLDISQTSRQTVRMELAQVKIHPKHNSTSFENDVAVALTKKNFTWSSTVNFLPLASITPMVGTECYISGWGSIYFRGPASSKLLYAMVPIVDRGTCTFAYGGRLTEDMLCAGYIEGTADACNGDSGGPLACDGAVAGIVSWGYGCAFALFPGVYTDVAYFKNWIEAQIENYVPNSGHSTTHYLQINMVLFLILCVMLTK
ncbi:trypsin alpha-3-like isoform X2 [Agrilus planipennis]|uniref:Trypsin alpha-3-like isoform X2 n=1 Tax=Agrilus planipennis TaxID=224129 RepID=A0A1W4X4J3_AGRPL|nr:trypsin alpha-3-like isoform X2 [Agrilus planipennis]